ncbi:MAG: peptidoglycan-binding protein [Symploca sp. SIO2E6]|nr:peptidoglycan-binding protein [Symploca sp. SIO2E6]
MTNDKQQTTNNKQQIYQEFLTAAAGGVEDYPKLMYMGVETSPYQEAIKDYASYLQLKPDGKNLVSGITADATFSPYPQIGQVPEIDEQGLKFLAPDITEACICISNLVEGQIQTKWLGRNALGNDEFWSTSKILPILNLVSRLNTNYPNIDLKNCSIRGQDQLGVNQGYPFFDLVRDVVSYEERIATSNSLGVMFKQFSTQREITDWVKSITGNHNLMFLGGYGEKPFIEQPELIDHATQQIVLTSTAPTHRGDNSISAYDLTRMISMVGWHEHLPETSRLPGVQWPNLEGIVRALGTDPARYLDLAITKLGLPEVIDYPVIISKLGNGATKVRNRTEAVYVALVQLVVRNRVSSKDDNEISASFSKKPGFWTEQPARLISFSMAIKGAKQLESRDLDQEVVELDAIMATEVTEILRRTVMGELRIEN